MDNAINSVDTSTPHTIHHLQSPSTVLDYNKFFTNFGAKLRRESIHQKKIYKKYDSDDVKAHELVIVRVRIKPCTHWLEKSEKKGILRSDKEKYIKKYNRCKMIMDTHIDSSFKMEDGFGFYAKKEIYNFDKLKENRDKKIVIDLSECRFNETLKDGGHTLEDPNHDLLHLKHEHGHGHGDHGDHDDHHGHDSHDSHGHDSHDSHGHGSHDSHKPVVYGKEEEYDYEPKNTFKGKNYGPKKTFRDQPAQLYRYDTTYLHYHPSTKKKDEETSPEQI